MVTFPASLGRSHAASDMLPVKPAAEIFAAA